MEKEVKLYVKKKLNENKKKLSNQQKDYFKIGGERERESCKEKRGIKCTEHIFNNNVQTIQCSRHTQG